MDDEPSEPAKPKPPEDDAWIERVVGVAGQLGFNKMRLRWKLIRFQNARRRRANLRQQRVTHITYAHKTCAACGAIQDRDEEVCTSCGEKLGRRGFQVVRRLGLAMPVALSMSTLLALAILAAYARVWVAAGGGLRSPSAGLLVDFGGRWPPLIADEPWRLVTAVFLHGGILHLGFNILAIATVGPRIEEIYGRATMIGLFIVTGVLANLGSLPLGGFVVGIGASGGVMGLIAAAAADGHRTGTSYGRALRNAMLQWMAYTFIAGFAFGADNWAHLFGAVAGGGFGLAVRPAAWTRPALTPVRAALAIVGLAGTLGALAIIVTRTPSPPPDPREDPAVEAREVLANEIAICVKLYAGNTAGAIAEATRLFAPTAAAYQHGAPSDDEVHAQITTMCGGLQRMRDACKSRNTPLDPDPKVDAQERQGCEIYQRTLDTLPVHAAPPPAAGSGAQLVPRDD